MAFVGRLALRLLMVLLISGCQPGQGSPSSSPCASGDVILATTTSTYDTGLLDVLLPVLHRETGCRIKPIAVGSGQALELGRRGEADVLLVHTPEAEQDFMDVGAGIDRRLVMYKGFG